MQKNIKKIIKKIIKNYQKRPWSSNFFDPRRKNAISGQHI
jgi:hypothetical protein